MGSAIQLEAVAQSKLQGEQLRFHRENVADLLGRHSTNFPGAQPVSFARKHLKELERTNYFVAEKTDGIRCLLYLTQLDPGHGNPPFEAQFLIDRKNDYYYIKQNFLHIPRALDDKGQTYDVNSWHTGTIMDGELVRDREPNGREHITFLMFDCLAFDNENITQKKLEGRLGRVEHLIRPYNLFCKEWPGEAEVQPFRLQMKKSERGYGAEMLFRDVIPKLQHGNDGLIYTCASTSYVSGTDKHILKWKPPHENTIDFRLQLGAFPVEEDDEGSYEDFDQIPEIELLVFHGGNKYEKFANLHLTDGEWEAMKTMNEPFDWRIIECWREKDTGHWRPKLDDGKPRFRDDKEHANHISTVDSVIESIEDAVTEEDLKMAAHSIRTHWKERAAAHEAEQRRRHEDQKRQQEEQRRRHEEQKRQQAKEEAKEEEEDDGPSYVD